MSLLEIKNLHARIGDTEILHGIDLSIGQGEVHAIMGPNGSGKSTLSYVLSGRNGYEVTDDLVAHLFEVAKSQRRNMEDSEVEAAVKQFLN